MWLTIILLAMFLWGLIGTIRSFSRPPRKNPDITSQRQVREPKVSNVIDPSGHHASDIEGAINSGHWDWARAALQKWSYSMVGNQVSQAEKDRFKSLMTRFAEKDPLYHEVMGLLLPVIQQNKGILQSKIYGYAPRYDQETIRYVLYFAAELGHIVRQKKGSSYKLFPLGETIEDVNSNPREISELLKKATAQAREKDYDLAIASLTQAYELMKTCSTEWGIKEYFRVARYHHLAGRYEEAMDWLQQLYDNVDVNADARENLYREWGWMQNGGFAKVSQEARENRRHVIYEEMELFKKRQAKIDKRRSVSA